VEHAARGWRNPKPGVGTAVLRGGVLAQAAQPRSHSCLQLGQAEGFGEVVIGAGVDAEGHVGFRGAARGNDDSTFEAVASDTATHLQAVHVWQSEIEDHHGRLMLCNVCSRCLSGRDMSHVLASSTQGADHQLRHVKVVLNHQNCMGQVMDHEASSP
jgi:hypothetical protein